MNYTNTKTVTLKPWQVFIVGIIFAVIGIALIVFGVNKTNTKSEKNKSYIDVLGQVIDYDIRHESEGKTSYASVVEYTVNDKKYKSTSSTYTDSKKPYGTKVRLGYNPNNPSEVIWVDDYSNLVLFIIGPIFIVIGLVISIGGLFKKNKNRDGVISDNQNNMINSELQQQNGLYNNPNIVNETGANVPLQNTNNNNQNNGNIGG